MELVKPLVLMGIGVPGSGKSTILRPMANRMDAKIISPDDIREELTGDVNDQTRNGEVWALAHQRSKDALHAGRSIAVDAVHNEPDRRRDAIKMYREHGAGSIIGVHVDTPIETVRHRNMNRDRVVPEHVIYRMYRDLQDHPPSLDEGFDKIIKV